jgi:spermidine synthase
MPTSKKWFCEGTVPGKRLGKIKHCFLIDKLQFQGKTPYQDVLIFDNAIYGRVVVLDGIIQLSERDEFIYHETISHPILFSHPNPQKILIIGGGDGGVLREVLKHPVKEVYLVDIDKKAVEIFKKYIPFVSKGSFRDKRAKIFIEDGRKFIKNFQNFFDVVIIDSNDPMGPSLPFFSGKFYKDVAKALKKNGIMVTLIGSFLDFETLIKKTVKKLKTIFPKIQLYRAAIPSYHCGDFCFIGASKIIDLKKVNFKKIEKRFKTLARSPKLRSKFGVVFQHYSPEIHRASMTLPKVWRI